MESILKVAKRRGKRSRSVVYDKPEKSMLSAWQFAIAILALAFVIRPIYRYVILK
jgi:hypothetical protein